MLVMHWYTPDAIMFYIKFCYSYKSKDLGFRIFVLRIVLLLPLCIIKNISTILSIHNINKSPI